jgi:DNA-binding MarR family transcriptional regulator
VSDPDPASSATPLEGDSIDGYFKDWARELPALDMTVEGIVERVLALNRYIRRTMDETLTEVGLNFGEWSVLGSLRRPGPPYRRGAGDLAKRSGITSGAMTNRLDRLEALGLVRRLADPGDRRTVLVELTEAGHAAWEQSVGAQAAKEALVASAALDDSEREQLNDLLRRMTRAFEQSGLAPKEPPQPH